MMSTMTLAVLLFDAFTASAAGGADEGWRSSGSVADNGGSYRATAEEERAIVQRVRAGDADAFRALMEGHFGRAARFAYTFVRERDAAEDIAQDVFARIWESRTNWTLQVSVRAYVLGAVRNRALDVIKHRRVEARHMAADPDVRDGVDPVGSVRLERLAELRLLQIAVAELPERRRIALSLRYEHELSHAEVGAALGVSAKAAKELILRTLDALRARVLAGR